MAVLYNLLFLNNLYIFTDLKNFGIGRFFRYG